MDDYNNLIHEIPMRTACVSMDDENAMEERKMYAIKEEGLSDQPSCAVHLGEAIRIKTISNPDYRLTDFYPFEKFLEFLKMTYPKVHEVCQVEVVNHYSAIFHWKSSAQEGKPVLLTAHYDVVPVEKSSINSWDQEPFSGKIIEGFIYGRGTLDDKNQVIAIMEALEDRIGKGLMPRRNIYIAFGFDEEVGGEKGAKAIASLFKEKNLQFEFVLDEGGAVIEGIVDGMDIPIALIGVAEKGSSNIRMITNGDGGHSSMPTKNSAIGKLSKIINNIEKNPMPAKLTLPVERMFKLMAPHMGKTNILLSHAKLIFPLLNRTLSKSQTMNSMIRTTISFTMTGSGEAENILPRTAWANANVRILPGDTLDDIMDHMRKVNKGIDFEMKVMNREEGSGVSPYDSENYRRIEKKIKQVFEGVEVMPYLMAGSTDSRKYSDLCDNIYRFSAVKMNQADLDSIHGVNERISVENLQHMVLFYKKLLDDFLQ
ncbi:MAG: M20/M25/M40 family metallo-hydrolase [Clostridiaceae bacterium]